MMGEILFLKKARPAKWIIEKSKTKLKINDQLTKLNSLAYPVLMSLLLGLKTLPCVRTTNKNSTPPVCSVMAKEGAPIFWRLVMKVFSTHTVWKSHKQINTKSQSNSKNVIYYKKMYVKS